MRVFIDATEADPGVRVFGMPLLERLLHALRRSGVAFDAVRVALAPGAERPPARAFEGLPVAWSREGGPPAAQLRAAFDEAPGAWLVLSAQTVVDARLIAQLPNVAGERAVFGDEDRAAVLRLEAPPPDGDGDLATVARGLRADGRGAALGPGDFDGYIVKLRRELEPYVLRVADEASRRRVERFLFWSNYKGSTDFMTRYVWPPLVWLLVRPLARWGVHPNAVTGVSIAATFAAIPFFAAAAWLPGLGLSYLMSVLDSVDGKLARLTFTDSKLGDVLDHGLDIVHPPLWYLGWAWGLSAGDTGSWVFRASLWMFVLYVADRLCAPAFKARTGKSIHGYASIDERMRTFISRRNVNLPVFTAALAVDALRGAPGWPIASAVFIGIVAWQALCLVFHVARVAQCWNVAKYRPPVGAVGAE